MFEDETRDYWDDYLPLGGPLVLGGGGWEALRWEGGTWKGEGATGSGRGKMRRVRM